MVAEALLRGDAAALTRKAVERALAGDMTALRLCLERIVPQSRSRLLELELPRMERSDDLAGRIGSILQDVAAGRLLLEEAESFIGLLETHSSALYRLEHKEAMRAAGFGVGPVKGKTGVPEEQPRQADRAQGAGS